MAQETKPFDEKAALEELERLLHAIEAARQAKQRKIDEFHAFTDTFRGPVSETSARPAVATAETPQPVEASPREVPPAAPASSTLARSPRQRTRTLGLIVGGAAIIVAAIVVVLLVRAPHGSKTEPPASAAPVAAAQPPSPQPASSSPAQPAAAAHPVEIDVRSVRSVWIRVVVDGRKDIERVVPAGQQLHFSADHTIVVRAGNGGDALVTSGGQETPLGVEGQPVTRMFVPR